MAKIPKLALLAILLVLAPAAARAGEAPEPAASEAPAEASSAAVASEPPVAAAPGPDAGSPAPAPADAGAAPEDLEAAMDALESQLNQTAVSSTRTEQRISEAPAVVTVITAEEIQVRGLANVADALRTVPGFYDVFDLVTHNIGVRGVNGGPGASGSVIKLMIDGQNVSYRPSAGNYFGEELIPIEAVDRIEVIRGPMSAVYGANAFMGVVNVITRSGAAVEGARLSGRVGLTSHLAGGGGALVGFGDLTHDLLVAADMQIMDRSGLELPSSSPSGGYASRGASQGDLSRPKSILVKASLGGRTADVGRLRLLASIQNLDASGEFQDLEPLTHGTRLERLNQTYRASWDRDFGSMSVAVSGAYFHSAPMSGEQISLGDPASVLIPREQASGFELALDLSSQPFSWLTASLSVDYSREDHRLEAFDTLLLQDVLASDGSLLRQAGTILPGEGSGGSHQFENVGGAAQLLFKVPYDIGITAGARLEHNSVYGVLFSPRFGAVWAQPHSPFSLKLLLGSSYKAPSAEQLYAQPMEVSGTLGNPKLGVQTARTLELAGMLRLFDHLELSLSLFLTSISGRIEFLQQGLYLQPQNGANEWFAGGELEARVNVLSALQLRLGVSLSRLLSRTAADGAPALSAIQPGQPLFPSVQAHLMVDWHLPWLGLRLVPEVSVIGPREASQSNALVANSVYTLPTYVYTALTLSLPERRLVAGRTTRISLRVTNIVGSTVPDSGFNGIDVPPMGRTAMLTLVQGL